VAIILIVLAVLMLAEAVIAIFGMEMRRRDAKAEMAA
jgi:hypothetical protein